MRALVVRHDHASLPGPIGDRLVQLGYALDELTVVPEDRHHAPAVDFAFPDPLGHDLLVLLGAPWSVYDRAAVGPWIDGELDLLRTAHAADIPVLGICFGAQALATALGGSVERAPNPEIGWMAVEVTGTDGPAATARPVETTRPTRTADPAEISETGTSELISAGPWFQWHFDRFVIPPGAVELARSPVGPQAFRVGRALGVQFHPEITETTLLRWMELGGRRQAAAHGVDPDRLIAETRASREASRQRAYGLVDGFLGQVART